MAEIDLFIGASGNVATTSFVWGLIVW